MKQTAGEMKPVLAGLKKRVERECELGEVVYCMSGGQYDYWSPWVGRSCIETKLQKMANFQIMGRYIEYTIRQLERRQIAESATKITRV